MRTVSLVNRLKWSFTGNLNPHAFAIGDADNDNDNEFVLGNLNGDLAIFKGECLSSSCRGLGTITCVAIGDIRNHGKNSVVCINAEGQAHIFDLPNPHDYGDGSSIGGRRRGRGGGGGGGVDGASSYAGQHHAHQNLLARAMEKPSVTLSVPVNVNRVLIADIDGDGQNELILARTDRILHSLQLHVRSPPTPTPTSATSTSAIVVGPSGVVPRASTSASTTMSTASVQSSSFGMGGDATRSAPATVNAAQFKERPILPRATTVADPMANSVITASPQMGPVRQDSTSTVGLSGRERLGGRAYFVQKRQWVFDAQITSFATTSHPVHPTARVLLIAQPGNTFTIIDQDGMCRNRDFTPQHPQSKSKTKSQPQSHSQSPTQSEPLHTSPYIPPLRLVPPAVAQFGNDDDDDDKGGFLPISAGSNVWPSVDEDDFMGAEVMDVPTEIALGRRAVSAERRARRDEREASSEVVGARGFEADVVGLLSTDGKFTLYDLVTHNSTHYELQVTQKLFGLCTFNTYTPPGSGSSASSVTGATSISGAASVTGAAASPISGTASSVPSVLSRRESLRDDEAVFGASVSDADISELALLEREEEDDCEDEAGGYDMFVACAWNGMTYLIDWSVAAEEMAAGEGGGEEVVGGKMREEEQGRESEGESEDEWEDVEVERIVEAARKADADGGREKWRDGEGEQGVEKEKKRFHVAKFAFGERVCAFAAGLYAVHPNNNVPCLFYVDFDDQIWVYHDVRISPSPVVGFLDVMDANVGEALERVIALEKTVGRNTEKSPASLEELQKAELDLGDEWRGIVEEDFDFDVGRKKKVEGTTGVESETGVGITGSVAVELELPDLVHRCLYDFAGLKEELEADIEMLENVISPPPEPVSPTSPLTPTQTLLFGSINTILAAKSARPDRNDDHSDTESLPTPTQSTIVAGLRSRESPEHMNETELEQVQQAEGPVDDGEGIEHKEDAAGSLVQEDEDKVMPLVMPLSMVSEASASLVSMEGRPVREEEVMDDESATSLPLSTGLLTSLASSLLSTTSKGIEHKEDTAGSLVQEDEDKVMPLVMPLPMVSEASASLVSMEGRPVREEEVMDDESVTSLPLSTGLLTSLASSPLSTISNKISCTNGDVWTREVSSGEISPGAGEISPSAGEISPSAGEISPSAGEISPSAGEISPSAGEIAPRERR